MEEAIEAMTDQAFTALARLEQYLGQRPEYRDVVVARQDLVVTGANAKAGNSRAMAGGQGAPSVAAKRHRDTERAHDWLEEARPRRWRSHPCSGLSSGDASSLFTFCRE
jgi:hypothetical protein